MKVGKPLQKLWFFLQGFLLLNALWFVASLFVHTNIVPNPVEVYRNLGPAFGGDLPLHIGYSLLRILAGLGLSLVVGVPIGILMACSKRWNALLYPLVYFSYPIPKTALLPVAMLLWGMRDGSKIAILFLIIVFQVIVASRDGVTAIDPILYRTMTSAGANRFQLLWHITLPALLPNLLTSIRVSLGTAVSVLFFVEGYGTHYGMGYYIIDAWSRIDYLGMYDGILVISLVGFALFLLIDLLSGVLCRWTAFQAGL